MGSPQEAVCIVLAVQEAMQIWRYVAIGDTKTCEQCNRYDGARMTRREIYATFPYLEKQSELVWLPHVHPNCRCELWLEEEGEKEYPFKPVPAGED